ncbi:hypothetical protein BDY24DRAFT_224892 [Mrakia frigida]|uniref:uncharacterized protein n=1 Tax=Mrakia frigida TaxID=29902 RepID=UPI003FCBF0EC
MNKSGNSRYYAAWVAHPDGMDVLAGWLKGLTAKESEPWRATAVVLLEVIKKMEVTKEILLDKKKKFTIARMLGKVVNNSALSEKVRSLAQSLVDSYSKLLGITPTASSSGGGNEEGRHIVSPLSFCCFASRLLTLPFSALSRLLLLLQVATRNGKSKPPRRTDPPRLRNPPPPQLQPNPPPLRLSNPPRLQQPNFPRPPNHPPSSQQANLQVQQPKPTPRGSPNPPSPLPSRRLLPPRLPPPPPPLPLLLPPQHLNLPLRHQQLPPLPPPPPATSSNKPSPSPERVRRRSGNDPSQPSMDPELPPAVGKGRRPSRGGMRFDRIEGWRT